MKIAAIIVFMLTHFAMFALGTVYGRRLEQQAMAKLFSLCADAKAGEKAIFERVRKYL